MHPNRWWKNEVKLYKIGEFSKIVNVPPSTLRHWHDRGFFIPFYISPSKTRYYSNDQIKLLLQSNSVNEDVEVYDMVGYCHIQSDTSRAHTISDVAQYISKHARTSVIFVEDIKVTNYDRLKQIIQLVLADKVKTIVVYDTHVFDDDTYQILATMFDEKSVQLVCVSDLY